MAENAFDPNVTFYGPHACDLCGATIVREEFARGGQRYDVPPRLLRVFLRGAEAGDPDVAYPQEWKKHVCRERLEPGDGATRS